MKQPDFPIKRRLNRDTRRMYNRKGLKTDELYLLLEDFQVKTSAGIYNFKKGYVWDQASVPQFLRGLLDNDSPEVVIAAMVHDANFSQKYLGYKGANTLFREMMIDNGMSKFKARLYWVGVASRKGKRIYDSIDKESSWHKGLVVFIPFN